MEEERRLAYVAVTRAKRDLLITNAARRSLYGQTQVNEPSRFLRDLPALATDRGRRSMRMSAPQEPSWNSDIVYDNDAPEASQPRGQTSRGQPVRRRRRRRGCTCSSASTSTTRSSAAAS
jgi:DNA helicase-2/ATP-dependent DNA helicase PcrA